MNTESHMPIPFDFNIETTTFTLPTGDYVRIERNDKGFFISGRVNGQDWHDEDHEDFFCKDSDQLLNFLELHGLLIPLSKASFDRG